MSDAAKLQTLQEEFGNRFFNGAIPANEYQHDGTRVNAHSTLIGSWRQHDTSGQPSRNAREKVRTFLLKALNATRPED
ncbi:MAG: hypothetical protein HP492_12025 [Nitrospira sp.]|nr:hypothetical protein [Nitrospira sp.]